jgi:hypothetical protein
MRSAWKVGLCVLVFLNGHANAAPVVQSHPGPQFRGCLRATIKELSDRPSLYEGRHVCVTGYLRRMVPYGEDSAALVDERSKASWRADAPILNLSIPFTLVVQERLSRYSGKKLQAVGTFSFDQRAYPANALNLLGATIAR